MEGMEGATTEVVVTVDQKEAVSMEDVEDRKEAVEIDGTLMGTTLQTTPPTRQQTGASRSARTSTKNMQR